MRPTLRKAKIVATVGPSSSSSAVLRKLFEAGVDTFRLNFSHGSRENHAEVHRTIRAIEADLGRPVAILQDLQGPKVRLGLLKYGTKTLACGQQVRLVLSSDGHDEQSIPLPHPEVFQVAQPGHHLLIDDGRVALRVSSISSGDIYADVIVGGQISDRKGVNVPDAVLEIGPLTDKDRDDLDFGLKLGMDWVALSFVQKPSDLLEARSLIARRASLMAKIEKPSALFCIDEIIQNVDGIMVARGDLGVEIPPEDVPIRQKEIVRASRAAGRPVVIATQMLDSMVRSPVPTRAEASDVATAIFDGADAVMLSAETATGLYPAEAVEMLRRIVCRAEEEPRVGAPTSSQEDCANSSADAIAAAAAVLADRIGAPVIGAFTATGATATRISQNRPSVPIVAFAQDAHVVRRLCVTWGVKPQLMRSIGTYDEMVERAAGGVIASRLAGRGDSIVVVAGIPFGESGTTNNVRILKI